MTTLDVGIKSTSINVLKMHTIASQHPSVATWVPSKKEKSYRKIKNYTQNIQLLQDLRFETATTKIKATANGEYLIASGWEGGYCIRLLVLWLALCCLASRSTQN